MPLACGWYAVVCLWEMLSRRQREDHSEEVNWAPLSEVMAAGTPNLAIQAWKRATAQSAAVVADTGTASAHLVDLSMMVKIWVKPREGGRGPTRSTCRCANRRSGMAIFYA